MMCRQSHMSKRWRAGKGGSTGGEGEAFRRFPGARFTREGEHGRQTATAATASLSRSAFLLVRTMQRAMAEVTTAGARHADPGAAHSGALAALGAFAPVVKGDPELANLLDLFRARLGLFCAILELTQGGDGDAWATAKAHIYQHCRVETAQQPYSLTALKLWVHHSRSVINGSGIIAHLLRGWVEGPFERWESCAWLSPADELAGDMEDMAVASRGKNERVQALITELMGEYRTAQNTLAHNLFYQKASGVAEDILWAASTQEKQLQTKELPQGSAVSHNTTASVGRCTGTHGHARRFAGVLRMRAPERHVPSKGARAPTEPVLTHTAPCCARARWPRPEMMRQGGRR
jgi:hypothetical protein